MYNIIFFNTDVMLQPSDITDAISYCNKQTKQPYINIHTIKIWTKRNDH